MNEPSANRKRLRRREQAGDIRFITFSCYRRLALPGNPAIPQVLVDSIEHARTGPGGRAFELFAWVIMPEHVHLLLRLEPGRQWAGIASSIKISSAKPVIARWRELRAQILARICAPGMRARFWQRGGGFDRSVRGLPEFTRTVKYIHRNPVERGLVERPEQWKCSSVRWWMGKREGEVACDPPPGLDPAVGSMEGVHVKCHDCPCSDGQSCRVPSSRFRRLPHTTTVLRAAQSWHFGSRATPPIGFGAPL